MLRCLVGVRRVCAGQHHWATGHFLAWNWRQTAPGSLGPRPERPEAGFNDSSVIFVDDPADHG